MSEPRMVDIHKYGLNRDGIVLFDHLISFAAKADMVSTESLSAALSDIEHELKYGNAEPEYEEFLQAAVVFLNKTIALDDSFSS